MGAAAQHAKLARLAELRRDYASFFYRPNAKQLAFHEAGAAFRYRILRAGNQLGKTYAAGMELSFHLTGLYPDWWPGKRFTRPVRFWFANETSELTRDGPQRILLGPVGQWRTGTIPAANIIDLKRARGVADAVETILVKHVSGGVSSATSKAYKDGREAWQSETLDGIWMDEEPPASIFSEAQARTTTTQGIIFLTFTPLKGLSEVVAKFWPRPLPGYSDTSMTIDDVSHIPAALKQAEIDKYPEHERDARAYGLPMLGSGLIYPVPDDLIMEDDRVDADIPPHWYKIIGLDIGYEHPTTAVLVAHDRDADRVHVLRTHRLSRAVPALHAAAIRPWGDIPVAWPRDALQHDKGGSCEQIAKQYRDLGLAMLPGPTEFGDARGYGVEAGLIDILQRMQTDRFRVARSLVDWHEERRGYHRKDGKVVKERDDLMDATRYAIMSLRFARATALPLPPPDRYGSRRRPGNPGRTWMSH